MIFEKVSFKQYFADRRELDESVTEEQAKQEYDQIKLPKRATSKSAGYDFYAPFTFTIYRPITRKTYDGRAEHLCYEYKTIPTGIRFCGDDSENCFLMCLPRSGLGFKYSYRLANSVGIIDTDYQNSDNEGHIKLKVTAENDVTIEAGKGMMQCIIVPFMTTNDDCADGIRNGGFGSTDKI